MLEIYKIPLVLCILGYASIVDFKTMHVPNRLWMVMLPFALFFFSVELVVLYRHIALLVGFVGLSFGAFYMLYFTSAFGAADLKGMMLLTLFFPYWNNNLLFIWVVLCASTFCMAPLAAYYLYEKFVVKDATKADKLLYAPFFPFLLGGFVLALFITPCAGL